MKRQKWRLDSRSLLFLIHVQRFVFLFLDGKTLPPAILPPLRWIENNLGEVECHVFPFFGLKKGHVLLQHPLISRSFHEDHSHSFRPPSPYQPLSSRRLNNEWRLNILLFENRFQPGIGDKIRSIGFRTVPWPKKRIVWIFLDNALFRKQFLRCHFSEA